MFLGTILIVIPRYIVAFSLLIEGISFLGNGGVHDVESPSSANLEYKRILLMLNKQTLTLPYTSLDFSNECSFKTSTN